MTLGQRDGQRVARDVALRGDHGIVPQEPGRTLVRTFDDQGGLYLWGDQDRHREQRHAHGDRQRQLPGPHRVTSDRLRGDSGHLGPLHDPSSLSGEPKHLMYKRPMPPRPKPGASVRIAVDIGGTFTDLVLVKAGRVAASATVLTTPADPS